MVKGLSCKHDDLSSIPKSQVKKPGVKICARNPSPGEMELGGLNPLGSLPASLTYSVSARLGKEPVSINNIDGAKETHLRWGSASTCNCIHIHVYLPAQT